MKIRNKEHQSLGIKQLKELSHDFPNDQKLGEYIRKLSSATDNNPEGTSVYEPQIRTKDKDNNESFKAEQSPGYTVFTNTDGISKS